MFVKNNNKLVILVDSSCLAVCRILTRRYMFAVWFIFFRVVPCKPPPVQVLESSSPKEDILPKISDFDFIPKGWPLRLLYRNSQKQIYKNKNNSFDLLVIQKYKMKHWENNAIEIYRYIQSHFCARTCIHQFIKNEACILVLQFTRRAYQFRFKDSLGPPL